MSKIYCEIAIVLCWNITNTYNIGSINLKLSKLRVIQTEFTNDQNSMRGNGFLRNGEWDLI